MMARLNQKICPVSAFAIAAMLCTTAIAIAVWPLFFPATTASLAILGTTGFLCPLIAPYVRKI